MEIIEAKYGANDKYINVTKIVLEQKDSFKVCNELFTDPIYGVVKELIIKYKNGIIINTQESDIYNFNKVALVCIAKAEKLYITEWISYYVKLGISHIYIYDNSDDNELKYLNNTNITVIPFSGKMKQIPAYNDFLQKYKNNYDYVAFFDCDEFLVLKKHNNISDFCIEHIKSGGLGINWYFFGNNGHEKYNDKPVLERFTKRQKQMNNHVKTIVKCSDIISMQVHNPQVMRENTYFKNIKGANIEYAFNDDTDDSICQLNHYFCKSTEELVNKCDRGRHGIIKRTFDALMHYLNFNDVEDLLALNFYNSFV